MLRGDVGVDSIDVTSWRWCEGGNGGGGGEVPCHRRASDAHPGNRRQEVVVRRSLSEDFMTNGTEYDGEFVNRWNSMERS